MSLSPDNSLTRSGIIGDAAHNRYCAVRCKCRETRRATYTLNNRGSGQWIISQVLHRLLRRISHTLPGSCIVCGQLANRDFSLCTECEAALPSLGECCRHCGVDLTGGLSQKACCASCQRRAPSFDSCTAAFPYASPINKLISDFKFSARFDIGYSLSRVLAKKVNSRYREEDKPELLIPVPLHRRRLKSRGFNQASEICRVISSHCHIPCSHSILAKVRNTEPQTSMTSASARKANLRAAFTVRRPAQLEGVTHIALIDDVVTTMATMEAISRVLRDRCRCRIDVWCLARASR